MSLSLNGIDKNIAAIAEARLTIPEINTKIFPHDYIKISENLYTNGGELQDSEGHEYIGPYHLHPTFGPMAGSYHINKDHLYLYWIEKLTYRPKNLV